jgi:arabinofuranan 3-O-arabinosyltransferase
MVLWTAAWASPGGEVAEDTKNDLYVDAWGFLGRSLHLWDPQTTFGVLQNQGYGYLFPMGPFFGLVGSVAPLWVTQRLWWTLLLTVGYLGALWLLRELRVGRPVTRHVAAVALTLGPRVVSTLGGLSTEAVPVLLAPLVLAPLVAATEGRLHPRRAAAWSAMAVLACGGVNATATFFAVLPAALWLVTRRHWWRSRVVGWWALAVVCATAWWVAPLLMLGRYSPPFLEWIEKAAVVARPIGLLDVLRGTTHWLGHLVTAGGPWWDAGYLLVSRPGLVVATTLVAAVGLAGLALRGLPHRGYLWLLAGIGVVVLGVAHAGPVDSPAATLVQSWLDGPLAPMRNVHKADLLLRLPLGVGLAHVLGRLESRLAARRAAGSRSWGWRGAGAPLVLVTVAAAVVAVASPALTGHLPPRGSFTQMSTSWVDAGTWLDDHAGGTRSLIVPASTFGEYTWGRTIDEPLRPLTSADYAVRDGVPLAPAGTIRLLDEVELRLQHGRDIGGAVDALLSSGVGYLVLRNDLDTTATGGTPVAFARSALRLSPRLALVAAFGRKERTVAGDAVAPVEIYRLGGTPASAIESWPVTAVRGASGASEALPALADAGLLEGPVVFDGDRTAADLRLAARIETDALRARQRYFGALRGEDVSAPLTASEARDATDYLPWPDPTLRSTVTYGGVTSVRASSSIGGELTFAGLNPAYRPFAALDNDPATAWVTYGDAVPTLTLAFPSARDLAGLRVRPFADRSKYGASVAVPTRLRATTDSGTRTLALDPDGSLQTLDVPPGTTRSLRLEILDTTGGAPADVLTGLASVLVPGVVTVERVDLAGPRGSEPTDAVVLTSGPPGRDGCVRPDAGYRCLSSQFRESEDTSSMVRAIDISGQGEFDLSGELTVDPRHPDPSLLRPTDLTDVRASSLRSLAPEGGASSAFDGDPATAWSPELGDANPTLTATFADPVTVGGLRLVARGEWSAKHRPVVQVTVDGNRQLARVAGDGTVGLRPVTGKQLQVRMLIGASDTEAALSLEVSELDVVGRTVPPLPAVVSAVCGSGPRLVVNDLPVPTRVTGPRAAAYGEGTLHWEACAPVGLGVLREDTVAVAPWRGFVPSLTSLHRTEPTGEPVLPTALEVTKESPAHLIARLGSGPERVLATTQNANPGWEASLGGQALRPVTLDGYRQGFVVPAGLAGVVDVRFGPDTAYRWALLIGGLLVLVVVAMAVRRERAAPGTTQSVDPGFGAPLWVLPLGGVALAALMAGPWGLLAGGAAALVAWRLRRAPAWAVVAVVVTPAVAAGLLQAVVAPGRIGSPWLETTTRLLVVAALVLAACAGANGAPRPRADVPRRTSWRLPRRG